MAFHQRLLPAHTVLKVRYDGYQSNYRISLTFGRQPGQGGVADERTRDLRAELLAAEAAHFAKAQGQTESSSISTPAKRDLESSSPDDALANEDPEAKRRRILEETRDIDADSVGAESDTSDDESDEEDETAELMRELEKIKREKSEKKAKEVSHTPFFQGCITDVLQEAEQAAREQEEREESIALGNPLLNPQAFNVKRRWDDDVVFKNQARGTEQKGKKEFVNVCISSVQIACADADVSCRICCDQTFTRNSWYNQNYFFWMRC